MGEAKKRRHCPALGRDISAADCGENRLSRHACPETCEHNPFSVAAYSRLLEIEDRLDLTTVKRLASENETARQAIVAAAREDPVVRMNAVSIWQISSSETEPGGALRIVGNRPGSPASATTSGFDDRFCRPAGYATA